VPHGEDEHVLDLKAKLLQAGLVDEDQVEKVEKEQAEAREKKKARREQRRGGKSGGKGGKGGKGGGRPGPVDDDARWERRVAELADAPKSDQYDAVRGWVKRTRLDAEKGLPSEEADRFHFETFERSISWLTIEPDVKKKLSEGEAGIIAYMSFNGLKHCVVPKDVAADVGRVRPDWVRVLDGFEVLSKEDAPADEAKPDEAKPDEAKPDEAKPDEKPDDEGEAQP
jgi:uncharacterized protein YaiL (DUF2058 family)